MSATKFKTPLVITAAVKTDSTNIRLFFGPKSSIIFNWETKQSELRYADLISGKDRSVPDKGSVPLNTFVTIRWIIDEKQTRVEVDGVERAAFAGNFSGLAGEVGIGTNDGATLTVKSLDAAGSAPHANREKSTEPLQIVDAKWSAGRHEVNVTQKLQDLVDNGSLHTVVDVALLGDPGFGQVKELTLTYQYKGERTTVHLRERDLLSIGAPSAPSSGGTAIASTSPPALPGLQPPPSSLHPYTTPSQPAAPPLQIPPPPSTPSVPAAPIPAPVVNPSAIERPEFANTPKPIQKNISSITSMMVRVSDDGDTLGLTTDIIASVPPETRGSRDSGAGFNRSKVGEDMKTSFEEAVRAVHLRYPTWEGRIDFSFGEKYTEHDGGSAGTAFGVLLLSTLEGFEIDSKCAVTGDITVDWKVRKVSGVASKIHGAILDKAQFAAIPTANEEVISDLPLLFGQNSLWDIQTLSIPTLQDAVATIRADREPKLAEALTLFATLQPALTKSSAAALRDPATIATLKRVLELAPNHLSAKALLAVANNTAPKTLSSSASLYRFSIVTFAYRNFIGGREQINRGNLPLAVTLNARKQIEQLRKIASKDIQPLVADLAGFVEVAEQTAAKSNRPGDFEKSRDNLVAHLGTVSANRELLEKLVREGY